MGYATIDFDKTVALINTTNPRYLLVHYICIQNSVAVSDPQGFSSFWEAGSALKSNDRSGSASKLKLRSYGCRLKMMRIRNNACSIFGTEGLTILQNFKFPAILSLEVKLKNIVHSFFGKFSFNTLKLNKRIRKLYTGFCCRSP